MWTALGAAAGVLVYRKGQRLLEQAQQQGVLITAQQAGASMASATAALVAAASRASVEGSDHTRAGAPARPLSLSPLVGSAAAAVLRKANS